MARTSDLQSICRTGVCPYGRGQRAAHRVPPAVLGSLSSRYRVSFHSRPDEGLSPQVCECKAQWLFVLLPLSPLLDTWLLHTLGLHEEMLSVSLLVQVLPFVFPGKDDIPDQTKATDPKGENKSPLLLFGNFLAFLPQKPQILFQNHQVIWALMGLQPIVMKNVQQSEQIPHCKRKQKIHLKCVFLSILLLALVCVCFMSLEEQGLLVEKTCVPLFRSHCPWLTPGATAGHRHYQAVCTFY